MQAQTISVFGSGFQWHCEPDVWTHDAVAQSLTIRTTVTSDFWQRTHYGFRADNGHLWWTPVSQDFVMEVHVCMHPLHQYDQAGLMVRFSPHCWLKSSVEYEEGEPSRLGCVVTNRGYSDWSTQNVPASTSAFALRVTRHGADYLVESRLSREGWSQLRVTHLDEGNGVAVVQCGVYACSPKEPGFTAAFSGFSLCAQ